MKLIFSAIMVSAFLAVSGSGFSQTKDSSQTKNPDVCRTNFSSAPAARSCELLDARGEPLA